MPFASRASGRRNFLRSLSLAPLAFALPRLRAEETNVAPVASGSAPGTVAIPAGEAPRLALIADCQFADVDAKDPVKGRQYDHSPQKLADAVAKLSALKPHLAINLGDLIDRDFASFGVVAPIFDGIGCPRYHLAGNHDYSVDDADKARVRERLGIPAPGWREVRLPGWRLLFLESNEVSTFRCPKGSPETVAAEAEYERRRKDPATAATAQPWNGALGETQRAWLASRLADTQAAGERALIFCHQPTIAGNPHSLWDSAETLALIAPFRGVLAAWINGHDHAGGHHVIDGIHHWNLKGMVETRENTYALATIHPDRIAVDGFGREPSRTLKLG